MVATPEQLAAFRRAKHDELPKGCTLPCAGITPSSQEDAKIISEMVCEGTSGWQIRSSTYATLMINHINSTLGNPSLAVDGWERFETTRPSAIAKA